ncbi:MAG: DUF5995 family protein [Acidimicrobiales bacterium]|nr:DUF5995 family protein [Acidimicrobiales bacterium]
MGASISATAAQLQQIALESTDARGYFAALYARVTSRIGAAIESDRFTDGKHMEQFACAFADYYVLALEGEVAPPRCWRAAWEVADDHKLLIVQHLLLGINAHVNHDLALAVVEVAALRGDVGSIRPDFNAVNEVLAQTYDEVVSDLGRVSRWATAASAIGGGDAFNFSLRVAREQAWRAAIEMHTLDDRALREYEAALDTMVSGVAYLITTPARLARPVVWLARRFEERDPVVVTHRLLGKAEA